MRTRTVTLTEQVTRQLRADIESGAYPVGSRLPTGRQLAEQYGVSAAVIREVTEHLRSQGFVESRQGVGCTVRSRTGAAGFQLPRDPELDAGELADLYDLRIDLEGAAAALAAVRRTDDDVAALTALLQRLQARLYDPQPAADLDAAFHIGIAAATHNPYYRQLLQYLNLQLHQAVATARANTLRQPGLAETVHAEHEAIVAAIRRGDAGAARAAAVAHLESAARRLGLSLRTRDDAATAPGAIRPASLS
ncbi:putative transcriptional regulator, GntR family [Cupriavidus taiwanensis]|uniref:FadR/GntR family transcriptional regulator n=1 Tax=Cupriavidus taiwanensis TaxID=164546 RepID=UPI000E198920|nr:FCD domain-containing protein [Cupriavidus taiwanensis]SOZ15972.1 putative transcriptional regulator, GntR family [Cupriavidus taiwanensis]SOZ29083.1 putative transcriptional regulator, GntR family [Cupriavidus taiwanensis]SOZ46544.1 putative transcriptional regulator, GntR family [Cupriavidus taiwanensis]SPA14724.1 putative transcriptional regulator, GntR family [Cupriavidus taiwanensis]